MKHIPSLLRVPLLSLVVLGQAFSQVPTKVPALMNYQAYVTDASNNPIGSGTPVNRVVNFRFWNHVTDSVKTAGGNLLYSHSQTVTINEGNFSVLLGQGGAITGDVPAYTNFADVFSDDEVFLGITVDVAGDGFTNDSEITPRQQLVSTAFAFRSTVAEGVDSGAITETMLANGAVTAAKLSAGSVGLVSMAAGSIKGGDDADVVVANRGVIVDGSIVATDLANSSVTENKIKADAVTGAKIKDGTVNTADLADDAVTEAKLADNAVGNPQMKLDSVGSNQIINGQVSLDDLAAEVRKTLCPSGTIVAFGGTVAPSGWLMCDGAEYLKTTYPNLHDAIGSAFGGSTLTFSVPDFRGRFLRGRDGGAGRDPDRASRVAMATGGGTGDQVGSVQGDAFKSHIHPWNFGTEVDDSGTGDSHSEFTTTGGSNTTAIGAAGGAETRPINAYVNYIIKY